MDRIAFVFPGQGAQQVGMGRDLYDNSPASRAVFEAVDAACGFPVSQLCFEGPDEALRETRNTQPALFAASVAALMACGEGNITRRRRRAIRSGNMPRWWRRAR